jgi:photosynthetic reaction center cytochrome c subunit
MKMMFAINENRFADQRAVTCYSCHRGESRPTGTPQLGSSIQPATASADESSKELPTELPSGDWLVQRYIEALGGADALEKINTRVGMGASNVSGKHITVNLFIQSPGKWALIQHEQAGETGEVFNDGAGWFTFPGRPSREMHEPAIDAARIDSDLQFPLHIQRLFPELRVEYPESIANRDTYVLVGIRGNRPRAKFYFDQQSGLLMRIVHYGESPLGLNPSQADYADYRDVGGVQVPFRVITSTPESSSTIQFQQIQQNVGIAPEIFTRPSDSRR